MPTQTNLKNIFFKDGTAVYIKESGGSSWTDMGAIAASTACTLNWDGTQYESGNAGKLNMRGKNFTIAGNFNLIHWDIANINRFGGGIFSVVTTSAIATTSIPDQVIASNWSDNTKYELIAYTSSSDDTKLRLSAKPTITSVTLDATGTPETLTELGAGAGGDYIVVADSDSYSGWSIIFNSLGMSTGTPKTKTITIDYGSNTPVASQTLNCGSSSVTMAAYELKFEHTDSLGLKRTLELKSVDTGSGGFAINFGGANEEGVEEIPFSFVGKCDSTLIDGQQLFSFTVENGAQ